MASLQQAGMKRDRRSSTRAPEKSATEDAQPAAARVHRAAAAQLPGQAPGQRPSRELDGVDVDVVRLRIRQDRLDQLAVNLDAAARLEFVADLVERELAFEVNRDAAAGQDVNVGRTQTWRRLSRFRGPLNLNLVADEALFGEDRELGLAGRVGIARDRPGDRVQGRERRGELELLGGSGGA